MGNAKRGTSCQNRADRKLLQPGGASAVVAILVFSDHAIGEKGEGFWGGTKEKSTLGILKDVNPSNPKRILH